VNGIFASRVLTQNWFVGTTAKVLKNLLTLITQGYVLELWKTFTGAPFFTTLQQKVVSSIVCDRWA